MVFVVPLAHPARPEPCLFGMTVPASSSPAPLRHARKHRTLFALVGVTSVSLLSSMLLVLGATKAKAEPATDCEIAQTRDQAMAAADACSERIEVMESRTPFDQVFAEPDGTMTLESAVEPQRVHLNGEWVDIDTSLQDNGTGRAAPAATLANISFSLDGTGPMVEWTADNGRVFTLDWPAALSPASLDGDAVVYPEVLPDVDLKLRVTSSGFTHVLIVKSSLAAADPAISEIRFETGGDAEVYPTAEGGLRVIADDENLAVAPPATMWDSSGGATYGSTDTDGQSSDGPKDGARVADVAVEVGDGQVTLIPDAGLLTSDEAVFPLHIDPDYAKPHSRWAYANNQDQNRGADPSTAAARVGRDPGNGWLYRSMFTFPMKELKGKTVLTAKFTIDLYHSWSCHNNPTPVLLYRSKYPQSTGRVSWSNAHLGAYIGSEYVASNKQDCPTSPEPTAVWAQTAMKNNVQSAAEKYATMTLAVSARSNNGGYEDAQDRWKKFRQSTARLVVTYNTPPSRPTSMRVGDVTCSADGTVLVADAQPTLSAKLPDPDSGQTLTGHFEYRPVDGNAVGVTDSNVPNNARSTITPPTLPNGQYEWRVRGQDPYVYSGWSSWCRFDVEISRPDAPAIASPDFVECTDLDCPAVGGPGEPGSFVFEAFDEDVTSYRYGWSSPPSETVVTQVGESQEVELTVPRYGENTLYVQAVDEAGNTSATGAYSFVVGRAAAPTAGWELERRPYHADPLTNTVAGGPALAIDGDVAWASDARLIEAETADFDGSGSLVAATSVDTTSSFSISAWVRLEGTGTDFHVGGFDGDFMSPLYFGYQGTSGTWYLKAPTADSTDGGAWVHLDSDRPAKRHQWTHLVAVVDRTENLARLYIDGDDAGTAVMPDGWSTTGLFRLGQTLHDGSVGTGWDGQVAEVRVFDRVVVPDDIYVGTNDFQSLMSAELVGEWSFDEDCCRVAEDQSEWNHDLGLYGGSDFAPGRAVGSWGLSFDGVDGFAASAGAVFRTDDSFSISAWARFDSNATDFTVVSSEAVVRPSSYLKYKPSTDRWRMTIPDADVESPDWYIAEDTTAPELGEWYHLVSVYDAASDELRLYVNGMLVSTVAGPVEPWHVDGRLLLGAAGSTNDEQWSFAVGAVDDVAVYQGVLTDHQVTELSRITVSDSCPWTARPDWRLPS